MESVGWEWLAAAALVAVTHTALGPDHTLPFVTVARARRWSRSRTLAVTLLCGTGHVSASLLLVAGGLAAAAAVGRTAGFRGVLDGVETARGGLAAWGLVAFGAAYALWGLRRVVRERSGMELHEHRDRVHIHAGGDRRHRHARTVESPTTFWALFVLLVLGPCEPLVALFLPAALAGRWTRMVAIAAVFWLCTVATMVALVALADAGLRRLRLGAVERWSHVLAGGVIAATGLAVRIFGL